MKAAQSLLALASREGIRACFANPGTSEMHLGGGARFSAGHSPGALPV